MKKLDQNWRHGQTFGERQKSYAPKFQKCPLSSSVSEMSLGRISESIQVLRVPQLPSRNIRRPRAQMPRETGTDPPRIPPTPNGPNPKCETESGGGKSGIPYREIRLEITSRADAECPQPPPNTPPRKSSGFECGDFIYDIPLDDHFSRELFQGGIQVKDPPVEDKSESEYRGDSIRSEHTYRHSGSSVSLPMSPKEEGRMKSLRCGKEEEHKKPPRGNQLRPSLSTTTKVAILLSHHHQRSGTQVSQKPEGSNNSQKMPKSSVGTVGGSQSQPHLSFVHNPRIAKFLEEIKAAKEKKVTGAQSN